MRTVQVHDTAVASATAGERVALGLPGAERRELRRGDALVAPGAYPISYRLDVELEELTPIENGVARLRAPRNVAHRGAGRPGGRALRAAAARSARRRGARRPRRPERRDDARRRHRPRPGAAAAAAGRTARAPRTGRPRLDRRSRPSRPPSRSSRSLLEGCSRLPSSRKGSGRSCRPTVGRSRRSGSTRRAQRWSSDCEARADESPLEPGLAAAELLPAEPWAAAVLPLLPVERRGGIAYLPGVAASLGAQGRCGRRGPPRARRRPASRR